MGIFEIIRLILAHPLNRRRKLRALRGFLVWQIMSRLSAGKRVVPFVGSTRLLVGRSMVGATGNVYNGLHDFEDMSLVLHGLRADDTFMDVGANVGVYSVLAAGVARARVIAFEPVPGTFGHLSDNIRLNELSDRVQLRQEGVGQERGVLKFTSMGGPANHVATADEQAASSSQSSTVEVPVICLDDLADSVKPTLMKIDVEGFETQVLAGGKRLLSSASLMAILIELNGSGARYGYSDMAIHQQLLEMGFRTFEYAPFERKLMPVTHLPPRDGNTLYVKDLESLETRLKQAPAFLVHGQSV